MTTVRNVIEDFLDEQGVSWEMANDSTLVASLSGTHKHVINVAITAGQHSLRIESFIARKPDENAEGVYRWLLEHNAKITATSFFVDHFGDIYISASIPLQAFDSAVFDHLLGGVLNAVDTSFNPILELGYKGAIEREWAWRTTNGMSTENLEAFKHLFQN